MGLFDWFRRAAPVPPSREVEPGDLVLSTSAQTADRAEAAMPGTAALEPLLELVPPPDDGRFTPHGERTDFGPDGIAEWSLRFDAPAPFACKAVRDAFTRDVRGRLGRPSLYVVTPEGETTYLVSSDAPDVAVALLVGWSLDEDVSVDALLDRGRAAAEVLAAHPIGFRAPAIDDAMRVDLARRLERAAAIRAVRPERVAIAVWSRNAPMDGRRVWTTLHRLGFRWGDMDCFQWADPFGRVDYLVWVEADDGQLGYVLPEEVAAGRQHFGSVNFSFDVARTPNPEHVLREMHRAAGRFAAELDRPIAMFVDAERVDDAEAMAAAVRDAVARFAALGVAPADDAVLQLR